MASVDKPSVEDIKSTAFALESETVKLLSKLVACDSRNGESGEQSVQDVMEAALKDVGFQTVRRVPINSESLAKVRGWSPVDWGYDNRENVVGVYEPAEGAQGKSLIVNGHVDVVPIEENAEKVWTTPPFQPEVREGRLYGRGAGDMKGGIVCAVMAIETLKRLGYRPAGKIDFHAVLEEECTGNGCLAVVDAEKPKADGVLIPEPLPGILVAQLGVMWITIKVKGKPVHVLDTGAGCNAIEGAMSLAMSLKTLEAEWNLPENRHPAYKDHAHPINFNIGRIHGGVWNSSVPSDCDVRLRVGFYPGQDPSWVQKEVEKVLEAHAKTIGLSDFFTVVYEGFQAEGCVMYDEEKANGKEKEFFETLAKVHEEVNGEKAKYTVATCTTDCRFYSLYYGIPTTSYGPEAKNIHGIDESVCLKSMAHYTAAYAAFIANWCGVQKL